jgi:hypothetical protein
MRIFTVCQKVKVCRRRTHRFPPRGAPHGLQQSLLQRMEHVGASRFRINRYSGATQHAALLWHAPATPREVTVRPSTHLGNSFETRKLRLKRFLLPSYVTRNSLTKRVPQAYASVHGKPRNRS